MRSGDLSGLTSIEAEMALKTHGKNELAATKPKSAFRMLLETLREPMLVLLLVAAGIYLAIGEFYDGIFLTASALFMVGIAYFQERKSERTLEALRDLSSPRALVVRDGQEKRVPSYEIVPRDLVILHEGDRVPADGNLVESNYLKVDESTLTGESAPVVKSASSDAKVLMGTLIVAGTGIAEVAETGSQTTLGKIGLSLGELQDEKTPLQVRMGKLVKKLAAVAFLLSFLIFVLYGVLHGQWMQGALAGIAAAISLLPEEFPIVLAVFMALGAWRISKRNVLTRKLTAIESLGSVTALCVDKTGTLTQNLMTVRELRTENQVFRLSENNEKNIPETFHTLIEFGALASHVNPFDPMDKAIRQTLQSALHGTERVHEKWKMVREYPLSDELRAISCVWNSEESEFHVVASKGAPESIIELCHLSKEKGSAVLQSVRQMAENGLRVLGVAKALFDRSSLPDHPRSFDFQFVGLLGLEDPLRPEAREAVEECRRAGIRVSMITGDYPSTAQNIASQIGLANSRDVMTGDDLSHLGEEAFAKKVLETSVFARILPRQKLQIVEGLQRSGEVVAMTGDGVNDAPALKKADIGVAMGARGTDVAREAADIVLLDDNFASIVASIRLGRRIYENIQKAMTYLFTIHIPIAGLTILPVLLDLPLLLLPMHLVFLELIIDPACTLVFEAESESAEAMSRPPRKKTDPLLSKSRVWLAVFRGVFALVSTLLVYKVAIARGLPVSSARTLAFTVLVFWNLVTIALSRSDGGPLWNVFRSSNRALKIILAGATTLLLFTIYLPGAQAIFQFGPLLLIEIAACAALAVFAGFVPSFLLKRLS